MDKKIYSSSLLVTLLACMLVLVIVFCNRISNRSPVDFETVTSEYQKKGFVFFESPSFHDTKNLDFKNSVRLAPGVEHSLLLNDSVTGELKEKLVSLNANEDGVVLSFAPRDADHPTYYTLMIRRD